jgi:hypothetical protein
MKRAVIMSMCLVIFAVSAGAQKTDKKKNSPDEKITVKREYDKNGNLISFDSLRVWKWSGDSSFQYPLDEGWENFFGKNFFDERSRFPFFGDSASSFLQPFGNLHFRFLDEDDLFKNFGVVPDDSMHIRNFLFHNDSSLFMGPDSSFMLPPGFFFPDMKGMEELQKYFDRHFKSFSPGEYPEEQATPFNRFIDPRQQEEWEKLMKKQQQELDEFNKKWNKQNRGKGIEKM